MLRFVALLALVAVALAEPEANAQFLVNPINTVVGAPVVYNKVVRPIQYHVPVVKQVVKYVDPHHIEDRSEDPLTPFANGPPKKTGSFKSEERSEDPITPFAYGLPRKTGFVKYEARSEDPIRPLYEARSEDPIRPLYEARSEDPIRPFAYGAPKKTGFVKYEERSEDPITPFAYGVPQKTDSVKIAEKQHELAKLIEDSKTKVEYVAPHATYAGVYPYVHYY